MQNPFAMWRYSYADPLLLVLVGACTAPAPPSTLAPPTSHEELVAFFFDWREFNAPDVIDGVPDYSAEAMAAQHAALANWYHALESADTTGWTVEEQVDWFLVWAELNGLAFDHETLRPWARDPAFYVLFYPNPTDVPEREGPTIHGAIELPYFAQPLSENDAADIASRLDAMGALYEAARVNLTGDAQALWRTSEWSIREQSADLAALAARYGAEHPSLADAALRAQGVSDAFADWVAEQLPLKAGPSGVGRAEYTWKLRNVHLLPYSWEEVVTLLERELARAHTGLRLEEHRNRALPALTRIASAADYDRLLHEAITEYLAFLQENEILPMKDYMDLALRERVGSFAPAEGLRGFFSEITYRDPIVMRTHHYHWFDLARNREEPHPSPIRATPLLYNAFDSRAEGMATGMEEMMMHAGLLDERPRARELVWILLAQRAARGLAGLYQHSHDMTFDESTQFASDWTPWGLLPADGGTIQGEEQFYLQQPGYGTSYVTGKIEIEHLIAEYARQHEGAFVLSDFMDAVNGVGVIPTTLVHWELTGDKSRLLRTISPVP